MTPGLRLRQISIRIGTQRGDVGLDLTFTDGLNVLRADNSSGKSTVLQSVIYALGLEGMLSARRDVPLPHSMTDYVEVEGRSEAVHSSAVRLEVENASGEAVVVERFIKNPTTSSQLVRVTFGPAISATGNYAQQDFFVRRPGAAQRDAGFHRFLAEFIGWSLPQVTRMDGSEGLLYLECLFPYVYVEQKHGWSGVQARIPTYLGIREVAKRSPEFLLRLDVFDRILARQRLRSAGAMIEAQWQEELAAYMVTAESAGVVLPKAPRISDDLADSSIDPQLYVGKWVSLTDGVRSMKAELAALESQETPTVADVAGDLERELEEKNGALQSLLANHAAVSEEVGEYERRGNQLAGRIEFLEEDLQRHKDAAILEKLGSAQNISMLADHVCPTCHQELTDGSVVAAHVMTTAENIKFIEEQLSTFDALRSDTLRVLRALSARRESILSSVQQIRRDIRSIRDSLTSRSAAPSLASINRIVELRQRLGRLEERVHDLTRHQTDLAQIRSSWLDNRQLLKSASTDELSERDHNVLSDIQTELQVQLDRYHFSSLSPTAVEVSRDTYRPAHEGFDLGFDLSASDMIRVIWAYLISFMHSSWMHGGNHPGLLIFDEPRQQDTARTSYRELLQRTLEEGTAGAQIIIATSESSESLTDMLQGAKYNLLDTPPGIKLLRAVDH